MNKYKLPMLNLSKDSFLFSSPSAITPASSNEKSLLPNK